MLGRAVRTATFEDRRHCAHAAAEMRVPVSSRCPRSTKEPAMTLRARPISLRSWRVALAGALVLGVTAAIAGFAGGPARAAGSGTTLTLYNAQHEQTTDALIAAFTKRTGIK